MTDASIYCIYISNNKYIYGLTSWYQFAAFQEAEEYFKTSNTDELFQYNNRGYSFQLKNHGYAYEMIKNFKISNKYNQYLTKGEENRNITFAEIEHPSETDIISDPPNTNSTSQCPICNEDRYYSARYPTAVCNSCACQTTTLDGQQIEYYNTSVYGGFEGLVNGEKTYDDICYINGKKCHAQEAKFGGIVVQLIENESQIISSNNFIH